MYYQQGTSTHIITRRNYRESYPYWSTTRTGGRIIWLARWTEALSSNYTSKPKWNGRPVSMLLPAVHPSVHAWIHTVPPCCKAMANSSMRQERGMQDGALKLIERVMAGVLVESDSRLVLCIIRVGCACSCVLNGWAV